MLEKKKTASGRSRKKGRKKKTGLISLLEALETKDCMLTVPFGKEGRNGKKGAE